jgi:hypothetical protein
MINRFAGVPRRDFPCGDGLRTYISLILDFIQTVSRRDAMGALFEADWYGIGMFYWEFQQVASINTRHT